MNLCVVVLLLAIQGLALSFRKGQADDFFGDEGSWKEDDWGENSASSTGKDDNFSGFDSGSSAKGERNDDEKPRTLPRIPRQFTNRSYVTSADGEDKSGSQEDDGTDSKYHRNKDQGSANEDSDPSVDLTKIGDALDVMKKLKKAKSDQDLVKKLKSGARVVMHSIVENLMNKTGRAITQKVGDFLSKNNAVEPTDGSGSATMDEDGSTEPETRHHPDTIRKKTDIPVEKVNIDFTKNVSKGAKAHPEKTHPSVKNVTDIVEKVKVSFNDKNVSESISTQTTKHASQERKNLIQVAKETTLDSMNKNATVKSQKNSNSDNSTVSTLTSATSLSKESQHSLKNNQTIEDRNHKKEMGNTLSLVSSGKKAETFLNNEETLQVTSSGEENHHITQHLNKTLVAEKQANAKQVLNHNETKGSQEIIGDFKSQPTDTIVQDASSDVHSSSVKQNVNTRKLHGNGNRLTPKKDVHLERVGIIKEPNIANNTAEKFKERENLKINFLEKSKRSHVEQNYNNTSQTDDLKPQRKSPLQNKSDPKTDSKENGMALSKSDQLALSAYKRKRLLEKGVLSLRDMNITKNNSKGEHSYEKNNEQFNNNRFHTSSTIPLTTSANSEKIVLHLNGKQELSKDNKTNSFVQVRHMEVNGNGGGHVNVTNDFSKNNKVSNETPSYKEGDAKLPQQHTNKTKKVSFEKTRISQAGSDRTQIYDENSKNVLDKDRVKSEVEAKQIERVLNNSTDGAAVVSKTQNKIHDRVEANRQHLRRSDHFETSDTSSVGKKMAKHTENDVESKNSSIGAADRHEELKKEKTERKVFEDTSGSTLQTGSNNVKETMNTTSHNSSLVTSARPTETSPGLLSKNNRDPPKGVVHTSGRDRTNSPDEPVNVARKKRTKKFNIAREIVTKGAAGVVTHVQEIRVANNRGNGLLQATHNNLKHEAENNTSLNSESGSGHLLDEGGLTRGPESHAENGEKTVVTGDSKGDLTNKDMSMTKSDNGLTHNLKGEVKHHRETVVTRKPKGVVILGPQRVVKHSSKTILDNSSKTSKVTHHESHKWKPKLSSQKVAKAKQGRVDLDQAKHYGIARSNEERNSAEVLTSRTPPTSLLTTSNDDNTYSIKEIVQGPRGSSLVNYEHSDESKLKSLKKRVVRLENEVIVLETAMADLAKRLLAVEQTSEHPLPTMPTLLHPSKGVKPDNQDTIHTQQQTTVYVGKDVNSTPQIPVPQYDPEKIVIPISSLYPEWANHVSTHSASMQEVYDDQEPKVADDSRSDDKSHDTTHVTLPVGVQSGPTSEAHAEVRPIVNIIVPNRREDSLSGGVACVPRCQNGGLCLDGNACQCPTFFTGDHCERFSLRDLLESPKLRERPYRKVQRVLLSELQDQQAMGGTLRLDTGSPVLDYRGLNINQEIEPDKSFVVKQQPIEVASPSSSVNTEGITRRRQLILEI